MLVDNGKAETGKKIQELVAQGWELMADTPFSFRMNMNLVGEKLERE